MRKSNRELWAALVAVILIAIIYLYVVLSQGSIPAARELFGHSLGIAGFILMLMTETLYSWRKRSRSARWGRMANWLDFHIFTGLVGPFLVLIHSSWKFNGLAGITMLLTVVIVLSGFFGRYIYTAMPRTADGLALEADEVERELAEILLNLEARMSQLPAQDALLLRPLLAASAPGAWQPSGFFSTINPANWRIRLQWRRVQKRVSPTTRPVVRELAGLHRQQWTLRRQLHSLGMARRLMALWHTVHVPIGLALFTAAFIHVGAALYYATLLH